MPGTPTPDRSHFFLRVIAIAKLAKAILLAAIGFGSLRLINRDVAELARHWAQILRIDPENHFARILLDRASSLTPLSLRNFGLWSLFFCADQVIEAVGLWFYQTWAKYLMLIATGIFLIDRGYRLCLQFSWDAIPLIVGTAALFLYILWVVRHDRRHTGAGAKP
jgi:uncharacterized membrane protein (DUF2068 family)